MRLDVEKDLQNILDVVKPFIVNSRRCFFGSNLIYFAGRTPAAPKGVGSKTHLLSRFFFIDVYQTIYQNTFKYIQIYTRHIPEMYKIPSGGGAALPAPAARRKPRAGPGLGAGRGRAAPPPLGILYAYCI